MPAKDSFIMFDEPETALSLIAQFEYLDKINKLAENNQVIMITHSKLFIEETDEVYDLDANKWISGKRYIDKIRKKVKKK